MNHRCPWPQMAPPPPGAPAPARCLQQGLSEGLWMRRRRECLGTGVPRWRCHSRNAKLAFLVWPFYRPGLHFPNYEINTHTHTHTHTFVAFSSLRTSWICQVPQQSPREGGKGRNGWERAVAAMQVHRAQTGALSLQRKGDISQRGRARQGVRPRPEALKVEGEVSVLPTWPRGPQSSVCPHP